LAEKRTFLQEDEMADEGLRDRLARQGEDALGKLAQDLLENPLINGAITRAFEARERASAAQEAALGALNIPSAADVERLTRRLRSVSQRLEGIEDGVDRLDARLAELDRGSANPLAGIDDRLGAIEAQLAKLAADVALLTGAAPAPVPREQERLEVDAGPAPKPRRTRAKSTKKG
jgi:CRP-like cAMP-binding protein